MQASLTLTDRPTPTPTHHDRKTRFPRCTRPYYAHHAKPGVVTVPHPRKDIRVGTLRNIYKQAAWDWRNR